MGRKAGVLGRARNRVPGISANDNDLPTVVTSNRTEREFAFYHSRIANRLKAAVHVHINAPDARGKIARGT